MKKVISMILAPCLAATALGGPQPWAPKYWFVGFDLKRQAWHATDILIVNEGEEIDGKVTVEEVLHGSKTVGDKLEFPGLAKLADPKERTLFMGGNPAFHGLPRLMDPEERTTNVSDPDAAPLIDPALPINPTEGLKSKVIPGHRMILFLGGGGAEIVVNYTSGTMRVPPKPDNIDEHPITHNMALIDEERLFAKSGRLDAPPIPVVDLKLSVPKAREAIAEILSDRARIERCGKITDAKTRASAAAPLMDSEYSPAIQKGFKILIGCGAEANPHVQAYLDKNLPGTGVDKLEGIGRVSLLLATVWRNFAKAASDGRPGEDFAPVVTEIADKEMEFWRREAPALPENWWNEQKFEARFAWHNRLHLTEMLVRALGAINTPETRRKIAEIRDFWKSQPRLMDKNGPDFLYGLCLAQLGEVPVRR